MLLRLDGGSLPPLPAPAVAVGNFDGVHLGHQALVAATRAAAASRQGSSVVLTFDPHPAAVIAPDRAPARLASLGQKVDTLTALGVDAVVVLPFDRAWAEVEASDFARRVIAEALHAQVVVVGADFRFGHRRAGDVPLLQQLGPALGFTVEVVPPVFAGTEPVSSTRVRAALALGAVDAAAALLGRPFAVRGHVVAGDQRGRTLGFPTANVEPEGEVLPAHGVYACRVTVNGVRHAAVANVGRRPTFGGTDVRLEAHLLDFERDLYGTVMEVAFERRLRGEQRFAGKDVLVAQIAADASAARAVLGER